MGGRTVIALASYELIKEAFGQPVFSGRLPSRFVRRMTRGCGILFTEGEKWSHQRNFSLRYLKSIGFARSESARQISDELAGMMVKLDSMAAAGQPVTTIDLLTPAVNSVISKLTLGKVYRDDDENYRDYLKAFDEYTHPAECLTDAYNLAKVQAESAGDFETYSDFQIVRVCMELFFGGTATTARSLEWLLLYMAAYPDEQSKVQQELDQLIRRNPDTNKSAEEICLDDRDSLHYTQAVIDECYRRVSLSSNGTFHRATRDAELRGYLIPKDAALMPLAYAVHHSERHWSHPQGFYPGHFLDNDGRYQPSRYLIPFMIGRRACLGEGLARQEIFLIFANLMRRYRVELVSDCCYGDREKLLEGRLSLIRVPEKHTLRFTTACLLCGNRTESPSPNSTECAVPLKVYRINRCRVSLAAPVDDDVEEDGGGAGSGAINYGGWVHPLGQDYRHSVDLIASAQTEFESDANVGANPYGHAGLAVFGHLLGQVLFFISASHLASSIVRCQKQSRFAVKTFGSLPQHFSSGAFIRRIPSSAKLDQLLAEFGHAATTQHHGASPKAFQTELVIDSSSFRVAQHVVGSTNSLISGVARVRTGRTGGVSGGGGGDSLVRMDYSGEPSGFGVKRSR
uniref:Cytochrome P450 n=1 Tax=Macrostomum lignano TaxID=282301 RepID=A0A1I8IEE5_9PLAT